MRILAIDFGMKRCGMAWTDALQISMNPLQTVPTESLDKSIEELLSTKEVGVVVCGLPTHADGQITKPGQLIQKKVGTWTKLYPEVQFKWLDESYSSKRAVDLMVHLGTKKKKRRQKGSIDQMTAVILLKDYLDKQ